jgi:hypothetical protein
MQDLIKRIRQRLETTKACTVFESDLDRIWPREKLHREKRELAIQMFAKKNGWTANVLDPGIRVTFRKAAIA